MPFKVPSPMGEGSPLPAPAPNPPPGQDPAPQPPPQPATPPAPPKGALAPMVDLLWDDLAPRIRELALQVAQPQVRQVFTLPAHSWIVPDGERVHGYFPLVLALARMGVHLYLWGGAGTGKSHLLEQVARALGREFECDSFSEQTTMAAIAGFIDAMGKPVVTPLARAYEHGRIYVADEFDAGSAPSVVMNRALANGSATFAGRLIPRHKDFLCLATANTRGGGQADGYRRQALDAATLDRFFMLELPVDRALQRHLCGLPQDPDFPAPSAKIDRGGVMTPDDWFRFVVTKVVPAAKDLGIKSTWYTSSRPLIMGAQLCAGGIGFYWLTQGLIRRGMSDGDWSKLSTKLEIPA